MGAPLAVQFAIALFTGMVAATFVPPVRRTIPRPAEVGLWIAFIASCVAGVTSVTDPNARELSASVMWAADQIVNTMAGLLAGGAAAWISDHRFTIISYLIVVAGADIFALILIGSVRHAQPLRPRVRLLDWIELPLPEAAPARRRAITSERLAGLNRRLEASSAVAGATVFSRIVEASTWLRDVVLPREVQRVSHAAREGRVGSRTGLQSLRDMGAHLRYAARAWFTAAGEPALNDLTAGATGAVRAARSGGRDGSGEVIDIQALLNAQSIGWPGALGVVPAPGFEEEERDAAERKQKSDRMAS